MQPQCERHKLLAWPSSESWMFWLDGVTEVLGGEEAECVDNVFMAVVADFPGLRVRRMSVI